MAPSASMIVSAALHSSFLKHVPSLSKLMRLCICASQCLSLHTQAPPPACQDHTCGAELCRFPVFVRVKTESVNPKAVMGWSAGTADSSAACDQL